MSSKNHNHKKRLGSFLGVVILSFCLAGCANNSESSSTSFLSMGTTFKIQIYDKKFDSSVLKECVTRVETINKWGNIFDTTSEISSVNAQAQDQWLKINPDFYYVLEVAAKGNLATAGAFDITVKPLIDFYNIKKVESGQSVETLVIPSPNLMKRIGLQNLVLDPDQKNRVLLRNQAQIDLSGILKGYALDEIVKILRAHHIQKALVNAGGMLYGLGTDENNKPWLIGIRNPEDKSQVIEKVALENTAIATSAGYERYLIYKGKKLSHIVNPKTGRLVKAQGSVTVVAPSGIMADIYSTAVYVDRSLAQKLTGARFYLH